MLLCRKAINLETGCGIICNKCYKYLVSNKMPPCALNNSMWVGDVPQELQELTLSEQKLIALYRQSSCVIKLFSITRDSSLAQTALKGNVIIFPQNVSEIVRSLPLSSDELPQFIKIIFVGRSLPKKDQLRSILTVRREIIRKALIWLCKNNILYKYIHIDHLLIDTLPINDIPDCLWNTLSLVDESESQNVERSGYVNNYIESNDLPENEIISLNTSALIDTDGGAISSVDIRRHLIRQINTTNEVVTSDNNIYFIPHGLYPILFPYGMGGVENECRQVRVTYAKHIRYFLSYHDYRFEMNTSFMFVTFNILQRRTACAKARILVSRPYFTSQSIEINQLTSAEIKIALSQIESNSYNNQSNPRLATLIKQLKTVSGSVMESNQSRSNYRIELHSQIFFSGLPNIFITINPCDLHHPLEMKFAGVDLNIDDLLLNQMPKSHERAAIVARHPVAIAQFFNKLISTVLSTLVAYNINTHESHPDGDVLGKIDTYYSTVEESDRGALHLHMLLWLADNKHSHELRTSITNEIFRENLIKYLEDIIKEDLSCFKNENIALDPSTIEKQNHTLPSICSPLPYPNDVNFDREKRAAICILASQNQIHHHTSTCYKYHKGSNIDKMPCHLRYPKELHDTTTINTETGEILMRRAHPMMNNFNEWLLLACRFVS
ncbi:unnamed protein product [Rotaria sp. Silwood2]|nr:unnamed protein product [Rotaria sp. Silwood2]